MGGGTTGALIGSIAAAALAVGGVVLLRRRGRRRAAGGGGGGGLAPTVVRAGGSMAAVAEGLGADAISVLSWNVLAERFAFRHTYCEPEHLAWPYRWGLITKALADVGADVICLQEVDRAALDGVHAWAKENGYGVAAQEPGGGSGKPVLCVTLYKASRFQLWWADLKRSRAVCCALLYVDSGGTTQVVYVANAHLEGHPERGVERLTQARGALASMARHQASQGLEPPEAVSVVMTGDFNEGPGAGVAHLLAHGWAPVAAPASVASTTGNGGGGGGGGMGSTRGSTKGSALSLADAPEEATQPYVLQNAYARKPLPYTRHVPRAAASIDQLWASAHARVAAVLHSQRPGDARGLPNAVQPSDHLPLGAVLVFPPAAAAAAAAG